MKGPVALRLSALALGGLLALGSVSGKAAAITARGSADGLSIVAVMSSARYDDLTAVSIEADIRNDTGQEIRLVAPNPCTPAFGAFLTAPDGSSGWLLSAWTGNHGNAHAGCADALVDQVWQPGQSYRITYREVQGLLRTPPGLYNVKIARYPGGTVEPSLTFTFRLGDFKDTAGHWAAPLARRGAGLGWVLGYPDNTFRPDQRVTWGEMLKLAAVTSGAKPGAIHTGTHWAAPWLEGVRSWAAPVPDPDLDGTVTRLDAVRLVMRMEGSVEPAYRPVPFADVQDQAVWAAYSLHIITGYPDGTFRPDQHITRAEALAMLLRLP